MAVNNLLAKLGYISVKDLEKVAADIWLFEDTSKASGERDFYFRSGNANAVNYICSSFGVDIVKAVKERR